ncbi:hypothetical protein AB1398_00435, partial [Hydrogenibacillus schlegelii]
MRLDDFHFAVRVSKHAGHLLVATGVLLWIVGLLANGLGLFPLLFGRTAERKAEERLVGDEADDGAACGGQSKIRRRLADVRRGRTAGF